MEASAGPGHASVRRGPARWLWLATGWVSVGLGGIGVVVPGVPTTVFFIIAAACFTRSSPRFEQWVLDLPKIGPLVRDYRAGLGMRRRAKTAAVGSMVVVGGASALFAIDAVVVSVTVAALVAIGAWYVLVRVPTRERVEAERAGTGS